MTDIPSYGFVVHGQNFRPVSNICVTCVKIFSKNILCARLRREIKLQIKLFFRVTKVQRNIRELKDKSILFFTKFAQQIKFRASHDIFVCAADCRAA